MADILTTDNIINVNDLINGDLSLTDSFPCVDKDGNVKKVLPSELDKLLSEKKYATKTELETTNNNVTDLSNEVASKGVFPIGSVYVQFPNMTVPSTLFGGTWEDISSSFSGAYFRALGTDSGEFGTLQEEGLPNIEGQFLISNSKTDVGLVVFGSGAFRRDFGSGGFYELVNSGVSINGSIMTFKASSSNSIYGSSAHVTPKAHAIKIWKRTA